jgi:polysaccharide export outer membrane protein
MAALLACLVALGGCTNQPEEQAAAGPPPALRIGPGDHVQLTVFGVTEMTAEYLVSDAGTISVPLAGQIPIANLTQTQAEQAVTARLAQGLVQNPQVSINVTRYRQIFVLGEVQKPGGYDFFAGLTVLNAIALGGGFTVRADQRRVMLIRATDPNRRPELVTDSTYMQPGDTVQVSERWF